MMLYANLRHSRPSSFATRQSGLDFISGIFHRVFTMRLAISVIVLLCLCSNCYCTEVVENSAEIRQKRQDDDSISTDTKAETQNAVAANSVSEGIFEGLGNSFRALFASGPEDMEQSGDVRNSKRRRRPANNNYTRKFHVRSGSMRQPNSLVVRYNMKLGQRQDSVFQYPRAQATGDVCELPQVIGTGPYRIPRWYFNPNTRRCELFYYSGCCGNGNNFPTYESCQVLCEVDPCTQDRDPGVGSLQIPRYFFNQNTKLCEQFTYFGSGGNRNNFASLDECRARCPENPNPCAFGDPMRTGNGGFMQCGFSLVVTNTCPANYYCHVGSSVSTTVCCPKGQGDRCSQPLKAGLGNENLPRWSFDSIVQQCREYNYRGLQGNENNFLSKADCENACFINPCSQGSPYRSGGTVVQCSAANQDICPARYYCHIGGDARTTVCCPVQDGGNRCSLPIQVGVGPSLFRRWYFDARQRTCKPFDYYGLGGNANHFLTEQECELLCPVFRNPCLYGNPCLDSASHSVFQCSSINSTCPPDYYCHIGATADTTLCCPANGDPCNKPLNPGTGEANLPRFYFERAESTCKQFIYTGSNGNENNFLSREECQRTCRAFENMCEFGEPYLGENGMPTVCEERKDCPSNYWCHTGALPEHNQCCPGAQANPCLLPVSLGPGEDNLPRWYFDPGSHHCLQFTYTGKRGNQNNFGSRQDCANTCPEYTNPCPLGEPAMLAGPGGFVLPHSCIPGTGSEEVCPLGYWCHVGADPDTTLCCGGSEDPCEIPLNTGSGDSQLPRWYFNPIRRSCESFSYRGLKGNRNNFVSRQECAATCPVFRNPCAGGEPAEDISGLPQTCSGYSDGECSLGFYCHVGAGSDDTVCCPSMGDPCELSVSQGVGSAVLPRWYFSVGSRRCVEFTYRGSLGNDNNFLSEETCATRCPVFINPCPDAAGSIGLTGAPISCASNRLCPSGFWCHVGTAADTTVCCRGTPDPCSLPRAVGQGNANLPRWFYDQNSRQCLAFTYRGLYGNSNTFLAKEECENACPVWINPCSNGNPILGPDNKPQICSPQTPCAPGYFCHLGAGPATTVCCQGGGDPCQIPYTPGTGDTSLPRWQYDSQTRTCRSFNYRGLRGNSNNFISRDDCEATCPVWINPCANGQPILGGDNRPQTCDPQGNTCPFNYWCHVGYDSSSTVCCPGAGDPCQFPLTEGAGQYSIPRWYFDANSRQCQQFTYRGMLGSQNNFLTRSDCESQCPVFINPCNAPLLGGVDVQYCSRQNPTCAPSYWCHLGGDQDSTLCCPNAGDPCAQPLARGVGSANLPRFYFDQNQRSCVPYSYTGLGGNQNSFVTQAECEDRCPVFVNPCTGPDSLRVGGRPASCSPLSPCPSSYWCHVGSDTDTTVCCPNARDPCQQPLNQGSGDEVLSRWYFSAASRQCISFSYRGLKGNQNNFLSREDCERTCPVFENPCASGEPALGQGGRPLQCGLGQGCPPGTNYWCHVGASADTTVCCPGSGDPCAQQMTQGSGPNNLPRWYYNPLTRQCLQFTYRGMLGNQNNFGSQSECETTCPVFVNPCSDGDPLLGTNGRPDKCSALNPTICGGGYWCHLGADMDTTVCCPGAQDPCQLPLNQGRGDSVLPRWYFNALTRQCVSFSYRGLFGNQNNFASKADCESRCPVFINPCADGDPPQGQGGQPRICSEFNPNCPGGYFCHFGAERDTTVCCPGRGNPCVMPRVRGSGQSALTRWYYDANTRQCLTFTYSGLRGNMNNFLSRDDCETVCPVFENPCPQGDPLLNPSGRPVRCNFGGNGCQPGYWCHLGAGQDTTVCCQGAYNPCDGIAMNEGIGPANLPRWYYNPFRRACENFNYKGMKGNINNFGSKQDCETVCPALSQACDGLSPSEGQGNNVLARWYFDNNNRQCRTFTYRGAKGNPNNFLSQSDCEATCEVWQNPCARPVDSPTYCSASGFESCPLGQFCHVGADRESTVCCPGAGDPCTQPLNQGVGNAVLPRFYYNSDTRQCVAFTYRGTRGNTNNFVSREQCETRCPVFQNPCNQGQPYMGNDNRPQQCNALTTTSSCPSGYWCHVGADIDTTVCCPGAQDPCGLSMASGTGTSNLPRWYYNQGNRRCEQFTYSGLRGNQNNFVSQQACRLVCREFENPCIGQPAQTPSGQPVFCSITNKDNCPINFWCHIGATAETTLCCPGATNPCSVPLAPGTANANLARWYYNADSRQCVSFTYNGMGGNQNNFLSRTECTETCPVFVNPCINGPPAGQPGRDRPQQCGGLFGTRTCPASFWCHLGSDPEENVCCPGAIDSPCLLPRSTGVGAENLPRWYFDTVQRKCQQFIYTGRGGNQNNFLSRVDCVEECPEFDNPCIYGDALMETANFHTPVKCHPDYQPCPSGGYFCLMGIEHGVCCPFNQFRPPSDPCAAPRREGEGNANMPRFYFNPISRKCDQFYYRGRKGNENNYLNREDCEKQCVPDINPCFLGDEPYKQAGRNVLCRKEFNSCPSTHYCHIGADEYSTVCCPKRGDPCDQQIMPGTGQAQLQRYAFSREDDTCSPFTYSGTGGNQNNFVTQAGCEDACPGFRGYCPHGKPLLVAAQPQECGVETACPNNYVCHINTIISRSVCCFDPAYFCVLPRDPGPCNNLQTKYGYNRNTGTCTPYQYGGCGGNLNNFPSLELCTEICCDKGY